MNEPAAATDMFSAAPADMFLAAADETFLVADLGATYLRIGTATACAVETVAVYRTAELTSDPVDGIAPAVVEKMAESWGKAFGRMAAESSSPSSHSPAAAAIGVAAYVSRDGVILQRRPFGLAAGSQLRDLGSARLGCPVVVDNDANLAALGEQQLGAGRGCEDFVLLTLGTNIGLGVVTDGRILRGAHGAAGEAGFLLVPASRGRAGLEVRARTARFGTGLTEAPAGYAWLEDLAGGGALSRSLEWRLAAGSEAHTAATPPTRPPVKSAGVFVEAQAGSSVALSVVRAAIESWAVLIADLVALFDPERIVLSGGLVEDFRPFLEPLRRRAADLSPLPPDIRIGELGAQAGLVGAAVAASSALAADVVQNGPGAGVSGMQPPEPGQQPIVIGR